MVRPKTRNALSERVWMYCLLAVLLVLVLGLSPASPLASRLGVVTHLRTNAQFAPSLPPSILIGYSPTTLNSLAQGIPVFSQGDQMWVESLNNSESFSVVSPDGFHEWDRSLSNRILSFFFTHLLQMTPKEIGYCRISTPMTNFSLPLQVVSQTEHSIGISLSSYSMQDGRAKPWVHSASI